MKRVLTSVSYKRTHDTSDDEMDLGSTTPAPASEFRVLIAEDDPALRDLMARLLAFEGYFVTEASDGQAMLLAVSAENSKATNKFDLIVTDVRMPGLSGLDALMKIRQSGCNAPAIVVSALPSEMVQGQAAELRALFLPKPFALENLRRIANRVLGDCQADGPGASGNDPLSPCQPGRGESF